MVNSEPKLTTDDSEDDSFDRKTAKTNDSKDDSSDCQTAKTDDSETDSSDIIKTIVQPREEIFL